MALAARAAARAATGICALLGLIGLAGCEDALGTSPPHAAPANPSAEPGDAKVELTWSAVTDATSYVIFWDNNPGTPTYDNSINDIEGTSFVHEGLTNLSLYHYKIAAETSGGRGPESIPLRATPGPVPGSVEWAVVRALNPGHEIHFAETEGATQYRIYFAAAESLLLGRRPPATFIEADGSPGVRKDIPVTSAVFYRVIAMNDTRIGSGGPVVISPPSTISEQDLAIAGPAFGRVNDDDCLDLPTATGSLTAENCNGNLTARDLAAAGLTDLVSPRAANDVRLADFNGDGFDELFSNRNLPADDPASRALLHVNQGNGNFQTSAAVSALGIAGIGGTLLAADFDNDGDVDLFVPNDQSQADGARNWLLINDGSGVFADMAAAAGVDVNPAGTAYAPRGGQAVDFNEDGFVDLLFGSRLLLNNGAGSFLEGSTAANMPVLEDHGLKLIDVDLDGDLDLIHRGASETRLFRNTGGVFDGGTLVGVEPGATFGYGLNACDFNGDGFEDIAVARNATATSKGVPKLLVNVNGSLLTTRLQEGTAADPDSLLAGNSKIACGDQNNDGMIDVMFRWGESYRLTRANSLSRRILLRIVGGDGDRNQQGRVVRVVPESAPNRIMTRVVESGSGLRTQNMYDLLIGAPWTGDYEVTVRFAAGDVTTTAESGDELIIFEDGRVEDIEPDEE